jgi:hypothetical protein
MKLKKKYNTKGFNKKTIIRTMTKFNKNKIEIKCQWMKLKQNAIRKKIKKKDNQQLKE